MNQETTLAKPSACENGTQECAVKPEYRVERRDDGISLHLALPGVAKDKVNLSVEQGVLTVSAERSDEVPEDWKTLRTLAPAANYRLAVKLHPDLDPASISAKLNAGVLTLDIERHEAAKPRAIEVN